MNNKEQTSQSLSDMDRQQRDQDCSEELENLLSELEQTKKNLANASKNDQSTGLGFIYAEKQRLEDQIKILRAKEKYSDDDYGKEAGNDNQTIISTSSVRRKLPDALKKLNK